MNKYSLKFYPDKRKKNGIKFKIYCRVTVNRIKAEFYTGLSIAESDWDKVKSLPKNDFWIEQGLIDMQSKVARIARRIDDEEAEYSARNIVGAFTGKGRNIKNMGILEYYDVFVTTIKKRGELSASTIKHYSGTYNILNNYLKKKRRVGMLLNQVNLRFIKDFDDYMTIDYRSPLGKKLVKNTRNKHHARLRALLNIAIEDELMKTNAYSKFSLKFDPSQRKFMSFDDLEKLVNVDLSSNTSLDRVRDIFLFSCYTGLRFEDALELEVDLIKMNKAKKKYLDFENQKTGMRVMIPLTKKALYIIDKHRYNQEMVSSTKIFPRISNQKFNVYIRAVADLANIKMHLTHHIARHTFATHALNNDIPLDVVSKLLGHTTLRTTQIYAKLLDTKVFREMEKMEL